MVSEEVQLNESAAHCADCGSIMTVKDSNRGELICCNCGLVLMDQVIDQDRNGELLMLSNVSVELELVLL